MSFQIAREDVIDLLLKDGRAIFGNNEMQPKRGVPFPATEFEYMIFDLEGKTTSSTLNIRSRINDHLVRLLLDHKGKVKFKKTPVKRKAGDDADAAEAEDDFHQGVDLEGLKSGNNFLYWSLVRDVAGHFGEKIPATHGTRGAGDAAAAVPTAVEFAADTEGYISFKRSFAPLELVEILAAEDADEEAGTEAHEAVTAYERQLSKQQFGPKVRINLVESTFQAGVQALGGGGYRAAHGSDLKAGFCDPSWGVNGDAQKYGGIDGEQEKWTRCVSDVVLYLFCLVFYLVSVILSIV